MDIIQKPSPNYNERPAGTVIDTIVVHYTGMETGDAALERLCDPDAGVSAHYLIYENGDTVQMVDEAKRAWHAGISHWRGMDNINHNSVGIELVNPGHEFGYVAFPEAQMAALSELMQAIHGRHAVKPCGVIGHSDIAPSRKQDPGELFPWQRFAREGMGLVSRKNAEPGGVVFRPGDEAPHLVALQERFAALGYELKAGGVYDHATELVVTAFQRHWRQSLVSGVIDAGTIMHLDDLLEQIG